MSRHGHDQGRSASQQDSYYGDDDEDDELIWEDYRQRGRSANPRTSSRQGRAPTPYPQWDPAYEPPRPGEYLRERQQIGPDHFLHFFVDEYGRERVVNKHGDVAVEERPW